MTACEVPLMTIVVLVLMKSTLAADYAGKNENLSIIFQKKKKLRLQYHNLSFLYRLGQNHFRIKCGLIVHLQHKPFGKLGNNHNQPLGRTITVLYLITKKKSILS
jgi:hypothetical protein